MRLRAAVCGSLLLGAAGGCDLFQTREPDAPSQGATTFVTPVLPELVLQNMRTAVAEHNIENYVRCFSDTPAAPRRFRFIPTAEAGASFTGIFSEWDVNDERNYFRNLGDPAGKAPFLSFSNQRMLANAQDSVVYNLNYTFFFPHRRGGVPDSVRGNMQLHLHTDLQRRWSIALWQDSRTDTDSTWSLWKAVFSGG